MLRSSHALVASALVLGVLATSCAPPPHVLRWRVEFATAVLRMRTDAVVTRVLAGGCDGEVLYDVRIRAADNMTVPPPLLGPGTYGLAAFAINGSCAIVASDCQEVVMPSEGELTLVLSSGTGAPDCPADVCMTGGCGSDAGPHDGGPRDAAQSDAGDAAMDASIGDAGDVDASFDAGTLDAGPRDGGPIDAGRDAGRDVGPPDTGTDAAVCTTSMPRAMGSFTSSPWFSSVTATGATIQFATSGGAMGTVTLSGGVTATGTVVASELCTATCVPLSFRGVTATDHTLTFRDWRDVESTITLVGATASGGLELSGSDGYLVTVSASARSITFSNGAAPAVTGTVTLTPETTCF